MIGIDTLITMIKTELEACEGFQQNITNHIAALRNQEEDDAAAAIGKSIAFNNRMIRIHLERADALVKAGGIEVSDDEILTVDSIRNSLDFLDYIRLLDECQENQEEEQ